MSCNVNGTLTLMCPPEGYVVDFDNPQQIGVRDIWGVVVGMNIVAFLLLLQRLHTKIFVLSNFQIEDFCVISAWVASVAVQAIELHLYAVKATGVHIYEMPAERFAYFSRVILGAILMYQICIGFAKATLCLFYRRLNPHHTIFQTFVWSVFFICTGSAAAIFFASLFACSPVAAAWDPALAALPTTKCINRPAAYIATAGIGVFTDVALFLLPLNTIWSLQMPNRQKLGLIGIFAVGSTTMITSIIRLVLLLPSLTTSDQTYALTSGTLWICIEANLLIMCCCLPTIRAFLRHVAPTLIGADRGFSNKKTSGSGRPYALRTWGGGHLVGGGGITTHRSHGTQKSNKLDKKMRSQATRLGDTLNDDDAASDEQDLKSGWGANNGVPLSTPTHTTEIRAESNQSWIDDPDTDREQHLRGLGHKTVTVKLSYEDA